MMHGMSTPSPAATSKDTGPKNPVVTYNVPDFDEFWSSLQPMIANIKDLAAFEPTLVDQIIIESIRRLAQGFYLLPASLKNHDSEPGGLVRHTLRVVHENLKAVPAFGSNSFHTVDRVAAIVTSLIHDVGRAWDVIVCDDASGLKYVPATLDMAAWVEEHKVTKIRIEWQTKRALIGPFSSEPLGVFFVGHFFPLGVVSYLGRRRCNSLIHGMSRSIGTPYFDLYANMKAADIKCAKLVAPHAMHLDDAFFPALASAIVTQGMGSAVKHAWVGPTHTVCTLFDGHGNGMVWEAAVRVVASHPALIQGKTVLDRLVDIHPNAFVTWKRNTADTVARYALALSLNGASPIPAIIVDNRTLWRDLDAAAVASLLTPAVFLSDPDRPFTSVVDPAAIGFRVGRPYKGTVGPEQLIAAAQAGTVSCTVATPLPPLERALRIKKKQMTRPASLDLGTTFSRKKHVETMRHLFETLGYELNEELQTAFTQACVKSGNDGDALRIIDAYVAEALTLASGKVIASTEAAAEAA